MNRTLGDNDLQESEKPMEAAEPSIRRPWVKPALERLSLKEALTNTLHTGADMFTGGS